MNNINPLYLIEVNSAQVLKAGQSVMNNKIAQGMNPAAAKAEVTSRMQRIANRKFNQVQNGSWNPQRWNNGGAVSNATNFLKNGVTVQQVRQANGIPTPPSERK